MLKSLSRSSHLYDDNFRNWELFYKTSEGELLVMFWLAYLIQIFFQQCIHHMKDVINTVRQLEAAMSINGFIKDKHGNRNVKDKSI